MRWETIASTSGNEIYQLWKADKKLLTLSMNPFSNSTHVETEDEKRVFLIKREGFRRTKTVLRNEYGVKLAEMGIGEQSGFIDVDKEIFHYIIQRSPASQLVISREQGSDPFIVCDMQQLFAKGSPAQLQNAQPGLLMALCWYMLLPAEKLVEKESAYQTAG